MRHLLLLITSVILFASCIVQEPKFRELQPDQIGHVESGIFFPKTLGRFTAGDLEFYDELGADVSIPYSYFSLGQEFYVTVYVFPAPALRSLGSTESSIQSSRRHLNKMSFQGVKESIVERYPQAILISEGQASFMLQNQTRDAVNATFSFSEKEWGKDVEYLTGATQISLDQWLIKFRFTSPRDFCETTVQDDVEILINALLGANK